MTEKQQITLLKREIKELKQENELLEHLNTATGALLVAANVYENAIQEISTIKSNLSKARKQEEDKDIKKQNSKINKVK